MTRDNIPRSQLEHLNADRGWSYEVTVGGCSIVVEQMDGLDVARMHIDNPGDARRLASALRLAAECVVPTAPVPLQFDSATLGLIEGIRNRVIAELAAHGIEHLEVRGVDEQAMQLNVDPAFMEPDDSWWLHQFSPKNFESVLETYRMQRKARDERLRELEEWLEEETCAV
jgi:hypothetical protein